MRDHPGVLAAAAIAALLGILFLGDKSFWLDEGYSVSFSGMPWGRLFDLLGESQANAGLYYVALKIWMGLGESEAAIRSLSVVAFVAAVPVLAAIARRTAGPAAAVAATIFFATNAFVIRYAQEARSYALLMLAVTGSTLLLMRAIERPSRGRLAAYAVVSAVAVYLHAFGLLVIGAHVAVVGAVALASGVRSPGAMLRAADPPVARLFAAWTGAAVLLIPLAAFLLGGGSRGQISWIPRPTLLPSGARRPSLVGLAEDHAGNGGYVLLGIVTAFAVAGAVDAWRSWRAAPTPRARLEAAIVPAWLLLPLASTFMVSFVKPVFHPRFLLITIPALALLVGRGVATARPRAVCAVVASAGLVLAGFALARWYGDFRQEDWRGAAAYVTASAEPGDAIAFVPGRMRLPFEVYADDPRAPGPAYPGEPWGAFDGLTPVRGDIGAALAAVRAPRVWLVISHDEATERAAAIEALAGRYRLVRTHVLPAEQPITRRPFEPGIEIRLYER